MLKDLSIALDAAKRSSHIIPLGKHSHSIYSDLVKRGLQKKDFSIVY
jgi:3-hydroxyisobutyrate dehydrogenase-like beta-hydroxyacid dehydrogenase